LRPEQVNTLETAATATGATYLRGRNHAIIRLMYDTGVRVGELVALDVKHLRDSRTTIYLPADIQKDYPTDNSPGPARLGLADETTRVLNQYLDNRWKHSEALFPSRSDDRITTQGARDVLKKVARAAEVRPYLVDGGRGEPDGVTPHALRHSVAYRMLHAEEGNTLYDVRTRLRHRTIQTTERRYDHFIER
jgi:integrase/recombinase XerC/integrase/recombinase XerD